MEPASECGVWKGGEGGEGMLTPHPPGSVTMYAKTTVHCSAGSSVVESKYPSLLLWSVQRGGGHLMLSAVRAGITFITKLT